MVSKTPWCVGSVRTRQAGAIEAKSNRQVLKGHLLEELIVGSLQERGINRDDRPNAGFRKPGCESNRMRFTNARVEEALGKVGSHFFELVPLAHRRRDDRDPGVIRHRLINGGAGGVGVGFGASALERQDGPLGANLFEDGRRVIGDRIVTRLRDAVALLSKHVEQHGALLVFDVAQPAPQGRKVVPVHRPDVAEAELLEEHSAGEQRFQAVTHLVDRLVRHAADERKLADDVLHMTLGVLVETRKPGPIEAPGQAADARTNGHLIVVQDHEQVLAQAAGIIEGLEDDARRQGAVADDGDACSCRAGREARRRP